MRAKGNNAERREGGGAIACDQHIVDPSVLKTCQVLLYCIVKSNKGGFILAAYLIMIMIMISWISLFQDYYR